MERFRTCFYRPLLSSSDNYTRWSAVAAWTPPRAPVRSRSGCWPSTSRPAIDEAVRAELEEYVVRRRAELGD
jgi:trimethylamine--corrinoid protein Co-methyltransferase